MSAGEREHLDRVRERFTRSAIQFARFALAARSEEAERLVRRAAPRGDELALDLACGPGTFTRAFASRVRYLHGVDLTPAMLEQARQAVGRAGLANVAFACADATALPFADSVLDLAVCAYSFHHFLDPTRTVRELSRVVRRGGRAAVVDIIVPGGADAELNNRIERTRDASHARTLAFGELEGLLEAAGLRLLTREIGVRLRRFDDWMQSIGWPPGTPAYDETRGLMEASIPGDAAGFHPRHVSVRGDLAAQDIEFVQTSVFLIGEKRS